MPWLPRLFPDEFFKQIYKVYGWPYVAGNRKMPGYVGKFINKYVYGYLPPGVLEKFNEVNPVLESGHRATQNHRWLTDHGLIHLDRQITSTITVMTLSADAAEFDQNFHKVHAPRVEVKKALQLTVSKAPPPLPLFPKLDEPKNSADLIDCFRPRLGGFLSTGLLSLACPVAKSTKCLAHWFKSRGRFGGFSGMVPIYPDARLGATELIALP